MELEKILRVDLWKAIEAHYERKDYTEIVRDALFYVCEFLREISGIEDSDGTKLIEKTLLGKNPEILVNKNETTTEKDIQQGIGFALKGLMMSSRNPLSHEKTVYERPEAEAIILYTNYLLNQIDHSGGYTKIDNILSLLYDEDFTPTEEYAELLLKEVPVKKRYDLLVELFNSREKLQQNVLKFFVEKLYESLSKASKEDFIKLLNRTLLVCKNNNSLCMYLHYFMLITYSELDKLVRLRIENFILNSICNGEFWLEESPRKKYREACSQSGCLATWINDSKRFSCLGNTAQIKDAMMNVIYSGNERHERYIIRYFSEILFDDVSEMSHEHVNIVNWRLKSGDQLLYEALEPYIEAEFSQQHVELFGAAFDECTKQIQEREVLPF